MANKGLEWKVGLFVCIGLALLGVLLLQFSKGTSLFRPTYRLYLTAKNVGGLKTRASVLMSGVQVGTVSDIELNPSGTNVTITLRIYKPYTIHQDARFVIETAGFLGDQYVAIQPTRNAEPVFAPGQHAIALEPFNLQEVARSASGFIQRIDETAKRLNDTISDVRRLVLNDETLTNLSLAILDLRTASGRALNTIQTLDALISTNTPSVSVSVRNISAFSGELKQLSDDLNDLLATNRGSISESVKNIESSTETLKDILQSVQAGKGLAGTLLQDEAVATNVAEIAYNLSITTSNLNRLGLWGILWSRKPPRTNSSPVKPLESPKKIFD
jgi:phospholipid/cholesterol/gamma-HCH transport system substrate-binding protein